MFAEPPSVVGIEGGQMVDGALGAAAVVPADCVAVSSPSPGNSRGTCELREAGALIPLELPLPGVDDPLVGAADVPAKNELNGSGEVGTLSGSVAAPVVVWAWAVVMMPRRTAAVRIERCIAFSCLATNRRANLRCKTTPDPPKRKMKFRKGAAGTARC